MFLIFTIKGPYPFIMLVVFHCQIDNNCIKAESSRTDLLKLAPWALLGDGDLVFENYQKGGR